MNCIRSLSLLPFRIMALKRWMIAYSVPHIQGSKHEAKIRDTRGLSGGTWWCDFKGTSAPELRADGGRAEFSETAFEVQSLKFKFSILSGVRDRKEKAAGCRQKAIFPSRLHLLNKKWSVQNAFSRTCSAGAYSVTSDAPKDISRTRTQFLLIEYFL